MHFFSSIFLTVDPYPSIGRCDLSTLSQEALMELFISSFKNTRKISGGSTKSDRKDISEWYRVLLNENGELNEIDWGGRSLKGTLSFEYLPSSIISLNLCCNSLTGSIVTENLPRGMRYLYLERNKLSGVLSLSALPGSMQKLNLSENAFNGPSILRTFLSKCNICKRGAINFQVQ